MERLSVEQERTVHQFRLWLGGITGPDDILPPDNTGVREPIPMPRPKLPALQQALGEGALCGVAA